MQPTTHETVSDVTQKTARPGLPLGLRARVVYGFLILALCLMITDFCRLLRAPVVTPFAAPSNSYHSNRL
jgi:hypothetical protein